MPTEVADESQCKALVQRTLEMYGHIDMLVNNAGIDVVSKLEDLPDLRLFKQVVAVNFYSIIHLAPFLPFLSFTSHRF